MTTFIAPEGSSVRVVWTAPAGDLRLIARAWDDGAPPSYGVQIRERDGLWGWSLGARDEARWRALDAVTRWLDRQARDREREKDKDPYQGEGLG